MTRADSRCTEPDQSKGSRTVARNVRQLKKNVKYKQSYKTMQPHERRDKHENITSSATYKVHLW